MTKFARLSSSKFRNTTATHSMPIWICVGVVAGAAVGAVTSRLVGYSQEYLEKVCFRAWSATASVTEP